MDMATRPVVEEILCIKGAQVGWSEICRNLIGYWVDLDPDPILVLMPDQKSAEDFRDERIDPLIRHTPAVSRHVSARAWDTTKHRIRFDTCSIFFAWAGSKTGTKSRPIRRLICEEPDEYVPFSSSGGDPLSKAEKRLTTYRDKARSLTLLGGTPTTRMGNIFKRWERCAAQFYYFVPCHSCNGYQRLQWKQVKWPQLEEIPSRIDRSEKIKTESLAYYECEHCKAVIRDHHKPKMLRRGVWATLDQVVTPEGKVVGPEPVSKRVGFHISGLYSPWVTFSQLAGEWLEVQGDPQALCDFVNQRLAEVFEEQRAKTEPTIFVEKAKGAAKPLIVPEWTQLLLATADTQGSDEKSGYFYYVIRAWGYDYRSQLIDYGIASSKGELVERCLERQFAFAKGGAVQAMMLVPDSGGPRWSEVYQMAQADDRIHPSKGAASKRQWMLTERPQKAHGVILWEIDTEQSKDLLHRLIHDPDRGKWMPHSEIGDDYAGQMCAEQRIFNPNTNREEWVEIVKNNNHYWDCESIQCAVAWRVGMGMPNPHIPEEPERQDQPQKSFVNSWRGRY